MVRDEAADQVSEAADVVELDAPRGNEAAYAEVTDLLVPPV